MKYHLVKLTSEIYEDDYKQGEGASTGCGYSGECIGKTFDTEKETVGYLSSTYGLPEDCIINHADSTMKWIFLRSY